jgi:hypothetical protein
MCVRGVFRGRDTPPGDALHRVGLERRAALVVVDQPTVGRPDLHPQQVRLAPAELVTVERRHGELVVRDAVDGAGALVLRPGAGDDEPLVGLGLELEPGGLEPEGRRSGRDGRAPQFPHGGRRPGWDPSAAGVPAHSVRSRPRAIRTAIHSAQRQQTYTPGVSPSSCAPVRGRARPQQPQVTDTPPDAAPRPGSLTTAPRAAGGPQAPRPAAGSGSRRRRSESRSRPESLPPHRRRPRAGAAADRAQSRQIATPGVAARARTRRWGYTPPQQPQRRRPGRTAKTAGNANMRSSCPPAGPLPRRGRPSAEAER